jgi:hypothetical protein
MISKLELKKELKGLGINVIKGNYIRKGDALKILKSKEKKEKKETKGNMADRFRQKTQTEKSHEEAKLDYLEEGTHIKSPEGVPGATGLSDPVGPTGTGSSDEDDDLIL